MSIEVVVMLFLCMAAAWAIWVTVTLVAVVEELERKKDQG